MSLNDGGAIVAMAGKNCFAIGVDHLLVQGDFTIAEYENKVHQMSPHLYLINPGLCADGMQFAEKMTLRTANYVASEQSPISPDTFAAIASWELYARKLTSPLFINPIIAGFYPDSGEVFLSTLDMAGCETRKTDFVCSQVVIQACERDTKSGWGATVYVVEPDKVTIRKIATRMD
ncbi:hypothetical protein M8J75_006924 [Diaphorina citri]|nr:hypothetical protein M8J75_006924 [Diaphorina citri]